MAICYIKTGPLIYIYIYIYIDLGLIFSKKVLLPDFIDSGRPCPIDIPVSTHHTINGVLLMFNQWQTHLVWQACCFICSFNYSHCFRFISNLMTWPPSWDKSVIMIYPCFVIEGPLYTNVLHYVEIDVLVQIPADDLLISQYLRTIIILRYKTPSKWLNVNILAHHMKTANKWIFFYPECLFFNT